MVQELTELVLIDYLNNYYSNVEKEYVTKNLKVDYLDYAKNIEQLPEDKKLILKVPKNQLATFEILYNQLNTKYNNFLKSIPAIKFDKHLYYPHSIWSNQSSLIEIKTVPVKLNEGETQFIFDLKNY